MSYLSPGQAGSIALRANRRAVSARQRNRVAFAIDHVLSAKRYHGRASRALAKPEHFAQAARALETAAGSAAVTAILWNRLSDHIRVNRLAIAFGVFEAQSGTPFFTVEELNARSDEGSRLALAAFGVRPEWQAATRPVRAAYALSRLVLAFREGQHGRAS